MDDQNLADAVREQVKHALMNRDRLGELASAKSTLAHSSPMIVASCSIHA